MNTLEFINSEKWKERRLEQSLEKKQGPLEQALIQIILAEEQRQNKDGERPTIKCVPLSLIPYL